ncbi:hypothetical protein CC80DRAFT_496983 [Byssothecium circinans]|uniref:CUE domain-containing protein n=1 Tax=Byssothecium circinans TaxID=147558 RepID=A0A6A5TD67_9PLEO|nr:hypothetical protein CC80DRAFT_496983 [Byssothecium circinans]
MSEKVSDKPTKTGATSDAESPTTARELDFDDDIDAPAPASATEPVTSPPPPSKSPKPSVHFSEEATEIPPPKPPRPMSPQQQAENTLIEAFPGIDAKVVKAVLVASGGNVEPAFNALLSMSDPSFKSDEAPPPKPPRPSQPRSQVEQDEIYARRLADHYQSSYSSYGQRLKGDQGQAQRRPAGPDNNDPEANRNFFDEFAEDLPEIRKNIEQGFRETQTKVNRWITDFKKKLDGEPDEYDKYGNPVPKHNERDNVGPSQSDQAHGVRKSAEARRSADRERYDSDNRMIGDDFEALKMEDNETGPATQRSNRPLANPDLFKPTPLSPPQSGPVDEVDALYRKPSPNNGQSTSVTGGKSGNKKWQPLTSVAPNPEPDDHDPFSLGDSDEEDAKTKDIKAEDTERLKKAAEGKEVTSSGELKPAERSGSVSQKDADAEALLKEVK